MNLISRLVYLVMLALTVAILIGVVFASAHRDTLAHLIGSTWSTRPHLRSSSVQPAVASAYGPKWR